MWSLIKFLSISCQSDKYRRGQSEQESEFQMSVALLSCMFCFVLFFLWRADLKMNSPLNYVLIKESKSKQESDTIIL